MIKNRRNNNLIICIILLVFLVCSGCSKKNNDISSVKVNNQIYESIENVNSERTTEDTTETVTEEATEEETTQSIAERTETEIVMVGDVLLHTPVSDSGLMDDGTYNYNHLFANVKRDIEAADIALVNQEVILGGREIGLSGYPAFNGAYEVGDSIVDAGFDVVLHATNHSLDRGKTGVINCANYWRNSHPEIGVVGINLSEEEQNNIYITEKNGIKIAVLNYTYGTNGIPMPEEMPYAVNLIDREKMARDISIAKENTDFIIVTLHWGMEYTHNENDSQRDLAKYLCEQGTDVIIGTHPHVIQPIEWIEAENGNKTLVYYSLGNFINATSDYGRGVADRMIGGMADFKICKNGDGSVSITEFGVVPLVTQMLSGNGVGQITTYKLSEYNEDLASANGIIERDSVFSYQYCVDLCNQVFGEEYVIK